MEEPVKDEAVSHPSHYQGDGGMEVIIAMLGVFGKTAVFWFCLLNAFKYICRCTKKGKLVEDLQKACWYINKAIEIMK